MSLLRRVVSLARDIEFGKIDLGREVGDYGCPAMLGSCSTSKPRKWYPSLWLDDIKTPLDLPDTGEAVIKYKVVSKTTRERDGKKTHDASIEVQSIEPRDPSKKRPAPLPGSAKPLKFSSLHPGMIQLERVRNGDGEFAPQAEGAPDPATMQAAYGGRLVKAAGAVAGLGGAALLLRKLRRKVA